jgi:hypothetical protein
MPNDVPTSDAALAILCEYPLVKIRSDMSFDEYRIYRNDWNIFNKVWAYNYTVRALRAAGGSQNYYQFSSDSERISYIRGQANHVAMYLNAAAAGAFNNIP